MWPGSDFMRESLNLLDFVVDMDLFMTDSARMADLVLSACSSFERSELNFYARKYVIWTHPFIEPKGESRPDNHVIFDLAKRLVPEDSLLQEGQEACLDWIIEPTQLTIEELKKYPDGFMVQDKSMPGFEKYKKSGFHTPSGKMDLPRASWLKPVWIRCPDMRNPNSVLFRPRILPGIFRLSLPPVPVSPCSFIQGLSVFPGHETGGRIPWWI